MTLQLRIPDSVTQAIRLPEDRLMDELKVELAIALYSQSMLSFGKARELRTDLRPNDHQVVAPRSPN